MLMSSCSDSPEETEFKHKFQMVMRYVDYDVMAKEAYPFIESHIKCKYVIVREGASANTKV